MSQDNIQMIYEQWMEALSADERAELDSIRLNQSEINDRFYTGLSFGTAGMRGVLGMGTNRMNIYTVRRATLGLARDLSASGGDTARGVVIAYDSRRMSARFARETALVLCAQGIRAYLFDALRPVPVLSFAVRHLNALAGVVITASHNPPIYNGYKVYAEDGAQLSPEAAARVTAFIAKIGYFEAAPMDEREALNAGLLSMIGRREVDDAYVDMLKGLCVNPEALRRQGKTMRIVYTPLHGSGNVPVRRVLAEMGVEHVTVVPEQELPDPDFPTVTAPNPEDPAAFKYAIPLADQVGADVIFGTDPDCDRLGVAARDRAGVFHTLTGNQIGCLMLHYILSARRAAGTLPANGAAVKSIVSTEMARAICEEYGVRMFDVLTGFKFIGEKIEQFERTGEYTFLFGFEESYGFLSGTRVRDKDGVNASLLVAEIAASLREEGVTLIDRLESLYQKYGYWSDSVVSVTLPGQQGLGEMKRIMDALRAAPPQTLAGTRVLAVRDYLTGTRTPVNGAPQSLDTPASDVIYLEMEKGQFACVRPSGTEPKIKLYVSACASTREDARVCAQRILEALRALTR